MPNLRQLQQKSSSKVSEDDKLILLAHAIQKNKEYILSHFEYKPGIFERLRYTYFLHLRNKGYPVAAITHCKEFYGLDFYVNKYVLIPRPETEMTVKEVINEIKNKKENITLIDIGTGSGCIPISILKSATTSPLHTFAIDISAHALKVAQKNARTHNVSIDFLQGDLLEPLLKNCTIEEMKQWKNIIITANLPYLTREQFDSEPSIQKEPHNALVAENNGLALYENLLQKIQLLPIITECRLVAFFEIDPSQNTVITELIKKYFPAAEVQIKKDLADHDRLVTIYIASKN